MNSICVNDLQTKGAKKGQVTTF